MTTSLRSTHRASMELPFPILSTTFIGLTYSAGQAQVPENSRSPVSHLLQSRTMPSRAPPLPPAVAIHGCQASAQSSRLLQTLQRSVIRLQLHQLPNRRQALSWNSQTLSALRLHPVPKIPGSKRLQRSRTCNLTSPATHPSSRVHFEDYRLVVSVALESWQVAGASSRGRQ